MRALADHRDIVPSADPNAGEHRSVAVVGAGITGLVAAYELRRRGVNVTLYEASGHTGGAIRTSRTDGFLAEHGPNSFVTSAPVEALICRMMSSRPIPRRTVDISCATACCAPFRRRRRRC